MMFTKLWSDHGELHYFTVSASTLLGEVNETMFSVGRSGHFTGADECGVVYPASRELDVHGKLAKDAERTAIGDGNRVKDFYFTIEERMEIHKKAIHVNYPWYAFSLSLPVEKPVPEQHADFPGQTYKDSVPVLFWNRRDGYHRGVYAKGRMYGDDFSYKACSKEEMTRLWNYHIEHENAEPCYHLTHRG